MESAIFGLVGVVFGSLLTLFREWWFQNRKVKKEAEYLAILVSCELERYMTGCVEVVADDGLCEGQPDENGLHVIQVKAPKFEPHAFSVEWKSLPGHLMYEVLDFPYKAQLASEVVSDAFQFASFPDFREGFEERQLQYAYLGIAALDLAKKLRSHVRLPIRDSCEWTPEEYLKKKRNDIELRRKTRGVRDTS